MCESFMGNTYCCPLEKANKKNPITSAKWLRKIMRSQFFFGEGKYLSKDNHNGKYVLQYSLSASDGLFGIPLVLLD